MACRSTLSHFALTWRRINEQEAARQLFTKLHAENERVMQLLISTKTNIFGQKACKSSS